MCGIVGWLSTSAAQPVDPDVLARMRDTMVHRGPDGDGLWLSPQREVGLAFRRLAIVDLSATANQPMTNEDGTVQVVFNGEIYNHLALRRELVAKGHRFRTDHSDTEVIVHGYEEWGAGVVERLHGMFGIGIWDARKRGLFLARDRVGIKPLYFSWTPQAFVFASEIKALLPHPQVEADMEPTSVYHYLSFLTTPAPLTMFRGIFKMPAGCRAFVDARRHDEGGDVLGRAAGPRRGRRGAAAALRRRAARLRGAARARAVRGGGREADDVGRAVRRAALGRHRLLGQRRGDVPADGPAGAHVHGRLLRPRAPERAAVGAARRARRTRPTTTRSWSTRRR